MPNLVPQTSEAALEVVRTTAPKFWKGESDNTFRLRMIPHLLDKYGLVEYNADIGHAGVWTVKFDEPTVTTFTNRADVNFDASQVYEQLTVDTVAIKATDSLSLHEFKQNSTGPQIVNLFQRKSENLSVSVRNQFCADFYNDGYTNTGRFKGLESMFYNPGTTTAADIVVKPGASYGGLSVALAAKGGAWSAVSGTAPNASVATAWPFGTGASRYDYLAPVHLNTSSTGWTNGTSWENNCEEVMRYMAAAQMHRCGKERKAMSPFVHLLSATLYRQTMQYFSYRNQQMVEVKSGVDLGLPAIVNFEGSWLTTDYNTPDGTGYYLCPEMMEFFTPDGQLYNPEGPKWETSSQAYLYIVTTFGNPRFNPKFFGKYSAVA